MYIESIVPGISVIGAQVDLDRDVFSVLAAVLFKIHQMWQNNVTLDTWLSSIVHDNFVVSDSSV